jgi:UPF0755 protein
MDDNTEYWKELLGDDYSEELMNALQSGSDKPERGYDRPNDETDDGSRFYNLDILGGGAEDKPEPVQPDAERENALVSKADDFRVNFDFDGEYRDLPDNRPLRPRREKRTGCLGGILYAVFVICICLLLASLLWLAATDILGLGNEDELVQVTVPQDFTIDEVAGILKENGLIEYKFLFRLFANFSGADESITAGTYELNRNFDYRALVTGMTAKGGQRAEVDVVIPEGYTLRQIIELFDANGVCTAEELWDTAANHDFDYPFLDDSTLGEPNRLEGYLFPDTYTFYVGDNPTRAFTKMLDNFEVKFKEEYATRAEELGYSVRDILTIASMIEKEAGGDEERDLIASVIYNRLNSDYKYLEIDATIIYAIAGTDEKFSTEYDSPYNTYMYPGLPAGPIANPGIASIKAALYPEDTHYFYYALNKDKNHNFFSDWDSFEAFINSDEYGG